MRGRQGGLPIPPEGKDNYQCLSCIGVAPVRVGWRDIHHLFVCFVGVFGTSTTSHVPQETRTRALLRTNAELFLALLAGSPPCTSQCLAVWAEEADGSNPKTSMQQLDLTLRKNFSGDQAVQSESISLFFGGTTSLYTYSL